MEEVLVVVVVVVVAALRVVLGRFVALLFSFWVGMGRSRVGREERTVLAVVDVVEEPADEDDVNRRGDDLDDVAGAARADDGRTDDDVVDEAEDPIILALPTTGALLPDEDDIEEDDRTGARALLPPLFITGTVFPPFPLALTATGSYPSLPPAAPFCISKNALSH